MCRCRGRVPSIDDGARSADLWRRCVRPHGREQPEEALRLARRTTGELTTARLTELTEEDIARAKALENCRKP